MARPPPDRTEDAWIRAILPRFGADPRVKVGIGHDAAVVALDGRDLVLKTDTVVDGVDFRLERCGPEAAARKALAVNVSDLAAMAAVPRACVVSAVLPRSADFDLFDRLSCGLADAAREFHLAVVGGDTTVYDGPLVLTVALAGEPGPFGVVTRAGALVGDHVSVTGALGGSILGRHLTFAPRLREAHVLAEGRIPHAMMDVSDGLAADVPRLGDASGVGIDLVAEWIPVHDDARRMEGPLSPLAHALQDGEDFELLLAHAPLAAEALASLAARGVTLHRIGTVTSERGRVRLVTAGVPADLPRGGYDHLTRGVPRT